MTTEVHLGGEKAWEATAQWGPRAQKTRCWWEMRHELVEIEWT